VFFALERLGAVAVTVSVDFRSRELEYIMRFSDSKMWSAAPCFRDFDHAAMAAELKPRLPALAVVGLIRGAAREAMVSLDDVGRGTGRAGGLRTRRHGCGRGDADGVHVGTTGNPKGVMHSHNTTLAGGPHSQWRSSGFHPTT
jgi:long-subunit acyl-CoA synthetase (AMP-forming)